MTQYRATVVAVTVTATATVIVIAIIIRYETLSFGALLKALSSNLFFKHPERSEHLRRRLESCFQSALIDLFTRPFRTLEVLLERPDRVYGDLVLIIIRNDDDGDDDDGDDDDGDEDDDDGDDDVKDFKVFQRLESFEGSRGSC